MKEILIGKTYPRSVRNGHILMEVPIATLRSFAMAFSGMDLSFYPWINSPTVMGSNWDDSIMITLRKRFSERLVKLSIWRLHAREQARVLTDHIDNTNLSGQINERPFPENSVEFADK